MDSGIALEGLPSDVGEDGRRAARPADEQSPARSRFPTGDPRRDLELSGLRGEIADLQKQLQDLKGSGYEYGRLSQPAHSSTKPRGMQDSVSADDTNEHRRRGDHGRDARAAEQTGGTRAPGHEVAAPLKQAHASASSADHAGWEDRQSPRPAGKAAANGGSSRLSPGAVAHSVSDLQMRLDTSEASRRELRDTVDLQRELIDTLRREKQLFKQQMKEKFALEVEKFQRTLDLRKKEYEARFEDAAFQVDDVVAEERDKRRSVLRRIQRLRLAKQAVDDMLLRSAEQLLTFEVRSGKELRTRLLKMRVEKIRRLPEDACRKLILDLCKIMDVYDVAALPTAARKTQDLLQELMDIPLD